MGNSADPVGTAVQRREESALRALTQATGDATLCSIARSGRSHPAAKYHEGAARAMADVRRALRRTGPGGGPADPEATCRSVTAAWEEQSAAMSGRGPDWAAYHAGGLDALAELADELDTSR